MLSRIRLACLCVLALAAAEVHAGFPFESYEDRMERHRNEDQQIGLATLHDVRQLSQDEVGRVFGTGFLADRPAFALSVEFREVLRGKPATKRLAVPFVFITGPQDFQESMTNKQREAFLEGRKAVVFVSPGETAKQPVVFNIWLVSSFEADESAQFWRKVTALWNTKDPSARRNLLKAGCMDSNLRFQDYCCRRLANWQGGKPDQNSAEQLDRLAALPTIWKRYLAPETPPDLLQVCDQILGTISPGWRTHPTRYDVLTAALRRQSRLATRPEDSQTDFNRFLEWLTAVSHFPGQERVTYRLFDELIQSGSPRYSPTALGHLSFLYRPHSRDAEQQRLNREIWDRLLAASKNPQTATSAADAIYLIAQDYAYVGGLPAHVSEFLDAPRDSLPRVIAQRIDDNFGRLRQKLPEISLAASLVERLRKEGHEDFTVPTRAQVGKKFVYVCQPGFSHKGDDAIFGGDTWSSWCSWYDAPVWIERPADWPKGGRGYLVVTGTLAERHDVPTFRLGADANAPFQIGLPVPAGYDAEEVNRRFVLTDVAWQVVETPQQPTAEGRLPARE